MGITFKTKITFKSIIKNILLASIIRVTTITIRYFVLFYLDIDIINVPNNPSESFIAFFNINLIRFFIKEILDNCF